MILYLFASYQKEFYVPRLKIEFKFVLKHKFLFMVIIKMIPNRCALKIKRHFNSYPNYSLRIVKRNELDKKIELWLDSSIDL